MRRLSLHLLLPALLLVGCIANPIQTTRVESGQTVRHTQQTITEDQVLDLRIERFDPGELPEDKDEARGLSPDIREAEARYIPIHLARTLEKSGYWGAVRVAPRRAEGFEVLIRGRILHSDGKRLELAVAALDARGETWFEREYEQRIKARDYRRSRKGEAFQSLYNQIANDLSRRFDELTAQERRRIRQIAELRFARAMAPDAFAAYLSEKDGAYRLQRLPAETDPHLARVRTLRDRDRLLLDTFNGHFENYYRDMDAPYEDWRRARAVEAEQLREIEDAAMSQKILGGLAVIGGIALAAAGAGEGPSTQAVTSGVGQVLVLGGVLTAQEGFQKAAESGIHKAALEELGDAFDAEAEPLIVQIEGETHRLTGSAEAQYAQWRDLLQRIYAQETALPTQGPEPGQGPR